MNDAIPNLSIERLSSRPACIDPFELPAEETTTPSAQRPLWKRLPERQATRVRIGDSWIGGRTFTMIGGPCSVESDRQLGAIVDAVRAAGAHAIRGGAYKPRTNPYSFQGLGEAGLELLSAHGRRVGLPVVTEVMDPALVPLVAAHAEVLQIGARNMQNYALLRAVGRSGRAVVLKRGLGNTLDELLGAAEYILAEGNPDVILCERGIRTFESATRFTLDIAAIPVLRARTHLPVIVDPSHAAGDRRLVPALARAAKAVGAHGIIVEIHDQPEVALSDGAQALRLPQWLELAKELHGAVVEPW